MHGSQDTVLDIKKDAEHERADEDKETGGVAEDPREVQVDQQVVHQDQQNEELQTQLLDLLPAQPVALPAHPQLILPSTLIK